VPTVVIPYTPQPKQRELHESPANEILFGGAAGPGKSMALRHEALIWCMRIPRLQVYLFRRTYPELEKNHIIPMLNEFPHELGRYNQQHKRWEWANGAMLHLCHCQYEKDVFGYQGAEIHLLLIDELTTFTEFIYTYLRGRVRCLLDVPEKYRHRIPGIICASNPGGIGHQFVKRMWVDYCGSQGGIKRAPMSEGGMLRAYIPGRVEDNALLLKKNPHYLQQLDALPEPYRTAYRNGNWEIFFGQMFAFNEVDHVCPPLPIPENREIFFTFDDGFARPFSCGWWWEDDDGRLYRCSELYGWQPGHPDCGLRLSHDEVAERIVEHERREGLWGRVITRLADPTCFNRIPDRKRGGQDTALAADFARHGIYLSPGDPDRKTKIKQFHGRLRVRRDAGGNRLEPPMVQIYNTCEQFRRTIPLLQADPINPDDVDTRMEDHVYDEAALIFQHRPLSGIGVHAAPQREGWNSVFKERVTP
jgi:hypothetical protein